MKKFASLLAIVALVACSESEKLTEANEDDVLVLEVSSASEISSAVEMSSAVDMSSALVTSSALEASSSSMAALSSALEVKPESIILIDVDSIIEMESPCGSPRPATQKTLSRYERLVNGRAAKLVMGGSSEEDAENAAKQDLYKTLGLDTLLNSDTFSKYSIKDAINFLFFMVSAFDDDFVDAFAESGTLQRTDFCGVWKNISWESRPNSLNTPTINFWAREVGIRGCVYTSRDVEELFLIFNNIFRKCMDLPYCDKKLFGSVKHAGLEGIVADTSYVCKDSGWTILKNYDQDIKDTPCDQVGKMFKSETVEKQYYVCKEDGWNITTQMAYETRDIPCDAPLKLVVSPTVDTLFYLCKDSEWKIATQLEIETNGIPCDSVGKIAESKKEVCSYCNRPYYICRDSGWDIATDREADIGQRACDAEGKTIQGIVNKKMFYVCYNNAWTDFYDAPCDSNNKRVEAPTGNDHNQYICYNGTWREMSEWHCDYPKEYFFNPDVEYGTLTDPRDGEVYKTVEVFGRTWMAENLRFATEDASQSVVAEEGCEIAGRYYSATAALTACPAGWRLPDSSDFNSFYTPEYKDLSGYDQSSYLGQFMSEIGEYCAGFACNVYGTSFIPLGYYEPSAPRISHFSTYYWVYGDYSTKELLLLSFNNRFTTYYKPNGNNYLPIRCVKE